MKFNLDSLIVRDNRVFAYGWAFSETAPVARVNLNALLVDGSNVVLPVAYGKKREDVALAFCEFEYAEDSGWMAYVGWEGAAIQAMSLTGKLTDGTDFACPLAPAGLVGVLDASSQADEATAPLDQDRTTDLIRRLLEVSNESRCALAFDHDMGGGANYFRKEWIAEQLQVRSFVLLVTFEIASLRLAMDVVTFESTTRHILYGAGCIESVAASGLVERVLYNDAVSFSHPIDIPSWLIAFKSQANTLLTMAVHDYFSVCPSQFLLNDKQRFCKVPAMEECLRCLPINDNEFSTLFAQRHMPTWRERWGAAFSMADEVICFSDSSRELLGRAYPTLTLDRVAVAPHRVERFTRKPDVKLDRPMHIGVVGAIGFHKGAGVIQELSSEIALRKLPVKISVIGTLELSCDVAIVSVTGAYKQADLPLLIEKSHANIFLLPSICPETFSYVTQELIDLHVPLACFDFGAPAERVACYELGRVLPLGTAAQLLDSLLLFHSEVADSPAFNADTQMKKTHVFTSAAFNYIPKVRMLFQSLREHHPEFVLHLALADCRRDDIDLSGEPFDELMPVEELDIPGVRGWAYCHRIVELATAIKPFALKKLLEREDCGAVLYMDPDTVAFSRLDDVLTALDSNSLVLTPHLSSPENSMQGVLDNEISCLKHGTYNLGFVGVKADEEGMRFAKWWSDRLYHFCRDDIPNGLFTDQRWIDLVPAFFDRVHIMRTARLNVATWNLRTRSFSGSKVAGYFVDGQPLGFYHFTGFDSGAHRVMVDRNAAGNTAVVELVDWYMEATRELGADPLAKVPWAYGVFSDGTKISNDQRVVYRERRDLQKIYPDPFDASGYAAWWARSAKLDHPDLFNPAKRAAGLAFLSSVTPGYGGPSAVMPSGMDPATREAQNDINPLVEEAALGEIMTPVQGKVLSVPLASVWVRAWRVLLAEGITGIVQRLRR
jgi:hypothetical protein